MNNDSNKTRDEIQQKIFILISLLIEEYLRKAKETASNAMSESNDEETKQNQEEMPDFKKEKSNQPVEGTLFNVFQPGALNEQPASGNSPFGWFRLASLGILSVAIPVVYFMQANELKRKEIETIEVRHKADSLNLILKFYKDTSLVAQRLIAYENYQKALDSIKIFYQDAGVKNRFKPDELSQIANLLNNINSSIRDLSSNVTDLKKTSDFNQIFIRKDIFNDSISKVIDLLSKIDSKLDFNSLRTNRTDTLKTMVDFYLNQIIYSRNELKNAFENISNIDSTRYGSFLQPKDKIRELQRNITSNKVLLKTTIEQLDRIINDLSRYSNQFIRK